MPRGKSFKEEIAVRQALELFWTKGYEATSLSDLTHTLQIGKGSFYDTFGSKRKLFDRCLRLYQQTSFDIIDKILSEKSDPVEVIRSMLYNHSEMMLHDHTPYGCLIANSTAELADDSLVQEFLQDHNQVMCTKLKTFLENNGYANQVDEMVDVILTHMTGISMMSNIVKDPKRFRLANDLFMRIFEEA